MSSTDDFLFRGELAKLAPDVARLIDLERERQARKLILIPSESSSPMAVREALGSAFVNVYAEGYPHPMTTKLSEEEILDVEAFLAHLRRYGDRRYYQGVEYADIIESLARLRCAEAFATDSVSADELYVNVQPLSGAPANAAVMQALLEPGDTFMGMSRTHGGHLTHGASVNISGQLYNAVAYTVDPETELLDYDQIEALALEHRPKMIVAGYSAYPQQPDWARFREIADQVGAVLLADIAHVAGMVIAGAYPSPVGFAQVITFTTHKTLCGPRGACILTTDHSLDRTLNRAVFPGLQGGPHVNKFAAMAVAFKLAQTEQFRRLQHQIVANAATMADAFTARGMRLACGGTNTHLMLLDCKTVRAEDGTPLMGDIAARVLDWVGIVTNKNSIPGDTSAFFPSGIRLGTPWVTQRGLREPEVEHLADLIVRTLTAIEPFTYEGVRRKSYRGKIDFDTFEALRREVADLALKAGLDFDLPPFSQTDHYLVPELSSGETDVRLIELEGEEAAAFVEQLTPTEVIDLPCGEWRSMVLLERDGSLMSRALIRRPTDSLERYQLLVPLDHARRVIAWLRDLSDGYIRFDEDIWAKMPGPIVVRDLGAPEEEPEQLAELTDPGEPIRSTKPYFIGLSGEAFDGAAGDRLPPFEWAEPDEAPLRRTPLFEWHEAHGAHLAPFGGWEMPLWYTSIVDEHHAVREAAGLFDVSHMGLLEARGEHAMEFLNLLTTNDVSKLGVGESQYSYLLRPDGRVIDDLMIYRPSAARYLLVVNAANAEKDWRWLTAVNQRRVRIDHDRPWARVNVQAELSRSDMGDLALQGPRSLDVLLALCESAPELQDRLSSLPRTHVIQAQVPSDQAPGGAFELVIARTGYTGEPMGFEVLLPPDQMVALWEELMAVGKPYGLQSIGLGARDSLRIEAGLPLYGHELDGPLDLRPEEAGFAGYVKLHKTFFVGRQAYIEHADRREREVVRFQMASQGVRVPQPGHVVADRRGRIVGEVTSCALGTEGYLVGQACVGPKEAELGTELNVIPQPSREDWGKPYETLGIGDRLVVQNRASVVRRFMKK